MAGISGMMRFSIFLFCSLINIQANVLQDCSPDFPYNPYGNSLIIDYNCEFAVVNNNMLWSYYNTSGIIALSCEVVGVISGLQLTVDCPSGVSLSQLITSEDLPLEFDHSQLGSCVELGTTITISTVDGSNIYFTGLLSEIPATFEASYSYSIENNTVSATFDCFICDAVPVMQIGDDIITSVANAEAGCYDFDLGDHCPSGSVISFPNTLITIVNQFETQVIFVDQFEYVSESIEVLVSMLESCVPFYTHEVIDVNGTTYPVTANYQQSIPRECVLGEATLVSKDLMGTEVVNEITPLAQFSIVVTYADYCSGCQNVLFSIYATDSCNIGDSVVIEYYFTQSSNSYSKTFPIVFDSDDPTASQYYGGLYDFSTDAVSTNGIYGTTIAYIYDIDGNILMASEPATIVSF